MGSQVKKNVTLIVIFFINIENTGQYILYIIKYRNFIQPIVSNNWFNRGLCRYILSRDKT